MSLTYKITDGIIRRANLKHRFDMSEDEFIEYVKKNERPNDLPEFIYKRLNVERKNIGERPMFKLSGADKSATDAVLFLHGGGGIFAPTPFHYKLAVKLAESTHSDLYFPFYPLAPEANADESLAYADKVYKIIEDKCGAENITVLGDSAGALLAANLAAQVQNKPRAVTLISPVTGTDRRDEASMAARRADVLLSEFMIKMTGKYWGKGIPLTSPHMNAEYIDFTDFPRTLLYYGTNEMFAPHMGRLINNMKKADVSVEVHEGKGMCHDWAILSAFPEGRAAFKRICEFICEGRRGDPETRRYNNA